MINLSRKQYNEMVTWSHSRLPNEACGLISGVIEGEQKNVRKVYNMANIDESPEHFSMAAKEQFAAIKDMRKEGWVLLGNYHSHPESPSRPSEEDKRLAYDPAASYLILSLVERDAPVLKSFRIVNGIVSEEPIEIVEEQ